MLRLVHLISMLLMLLMEMTAYADALPSSKKIELDLREQLGAMIHQSLPRQAHGLLGIFSVTVLSRETITEDRFSTHVRIVKGRTKLVLPPSSARGPDPIQALSMVSPGTSIVEETRVFFRLRQGEWTIERFEGISSNSQAFKTALQKAELEYNSTHR